MTLRFIVLSVVLLCLSSISIANPYKLDAVAMQSRYLNAVEVPLVNFDYSPSKNLASKNLVVDQNIVGIMAICCGTFGLHRFYMGQTEAGLQHLAITVLTTLIGGAGLYILNASSINNGTTGGGTNIGGLGFVGVLGYGFAYCASGAHGIYSLVEGIMYLTMPEEKFQSKIAKDPRFFAAFSRN